MTIIVEGTHLSFLNHITRKIVHRTTYRTWATSAAREVLRSSGMQTAVTYIGHRRWTVAQRVDIIPISKVFVQDQGFEVEGRRRKPWWQ